MGKSTINWGKWARVKTVILHDACGLLAGIDLFLHRRTLKYWDKWVLTEHESTGSIKSHATDERCKQIDADFDEIVKLEAILEVVQGYIDDDDFIDITHVKFLENDIIQHCMKASMLEHGELSENQYAVIPKVDLAEFGSWAKEVGYELPPQFPVKKNTIATDNLSNHKMQIHPDLKTYSLKQASRIITDITRREHTKKNLIGLAKENKINISFHKSEWEYVRIDEKRYGMENVYCDVLAISLVAPKDRSFVAGLATPYMGSDESIFPFVNSTSLKRIDDDGNTSILSYDLTAYDNGEKIKVSTVESTRFPKEGDAEYQSFRLWLLTGYGIISKRSDNSKPIIPSNFLKETYYYKLKGSDNSNIFPLIKINEKDFCITKKELLRYLEGKGGATLKIKASIPVRDKDSDYQSAWGVNFKVTDEGLIAELPKDEAQAMIEARRAVSIEPLDDFYPLDTAFPFLHTQNPLGYPNNQEVYKLASKGRIQLSIKTMRDISFVTRAGISTVVETKMAGETTHSTPIISVPADEILDVDTYSRVPEKNRAILFPSGAVYQGEKLFVQLGWVDTIDYWDEDNYAEIAVIGFKKEELVKRLIQPKQLEENESSCEAESNKKKLDKAKEALWVIEACYDENGEGKMIQGSGFQLRDGGIITCEHVVIDENGKKFKNLKAHKISKPSKKYNLKVDKTCHVRDVAICSIPSSENPSKSYLGKSEKEAKQQLNIKLLGFPAHDFGDKEPAVVDAKIARSYTRSTIQKFEIDQSIREGNSGGPIIDVDFNVIGIALEGATKESGRNGCLHISELEKLTSN